MSPKVMLKKKSLQFLISVIMISCFSTVFSDTIALPDPLEAGWMGKKVCEKLHEDDKQRVLRCTFPPGVGHERHYHSPSFGYTLEAGKVRITDKTGVRELSLTKGNSRFSTGTDWHEIINIGNSTIVYLLIEIK